MYLSMKNNAPWSQNFNWKCNNYPSIHSFSATASTALLVVGMPSAYPSCLQGKTGLPVCRRALTLLQSFQFASRACFWSKPGGWNPQREPTQAHREHWKSTQRGPEDSGSSPRSFCWEATVLIIHQLKTKSSELKTTAQSIEYNSTTQSNLLER